MADVPENGLHQALEAAGDGAFLVDAEGRIVLWNRSAERLLGYAVAEALGRRCCDLLAGRGAAGEPVCAPDCAVRDAARRGLAVESFDMQARTKAGRPVWLNVSTLALAPDARRGPSMAHLFRDASAPADHRPAPAGPAAPSAADSLTTRERQVLRLLVSGANTRRIAERLGVRPATVRNHIQNLFRKFGVHSRLEAVAYATGHHLV